MISAGEVGAVFEIKDDASPVLQRMAEEFNRLQGTIDRVKESMAHMGGGSFGGAGEETVLGRLMKDMEKLAETGVTTSTAITDSFSKIDVGPAIAKVGELKRSLEETAAAANAIHIGGGNGGGGGGTGGSGSGGSGSHGGGRGGFMSHLNKHVGSEVMSGLMSVPGMIGEYAGYEAFKEGFNVAETENNMRIAGISEDKIKQADEAAGGYAKFGMSKLQVLNVLRLASVPLNTGGTSDTGIDAGMAVLPTIAKFDQLARAQKGEEGGDATKQIYDLFKADELRNKLTPDQAQKFIEDYSQVFTGTQGRIDPKTFYQGLKYSKSAGAQFSDEFVKYYLPGIEAEEGGSTAGTMLMTDASAMLGRRLKKPALAELGKMGIYDGNDKLVDAERMIENPFEYMQKDMMPAMIKAGLTSKDQQLEFMERIFNRNAAEAGVLLGINPGNVERTAGAIKRSDTLNDATGKINANDPMAAMEQLKAGLANLGAAFSGPYIPAITSGLQGLAAAMDKLASWTHPAIDPATGKPMDVMNPHGPFLLRRPDVPMTPDEIGMPMVHPQDARPSRPNLSMFADQPRGAPPAPPPVTVNANITASPGTANITVQNHIDNTGLITEVMSKISVLVSGLIAKGMASAGATNSSAGVDGRANPITPDTSGAMMGP
jgi:hypothetical protein